MTSVLASGPIYTSSFFWLVAAPVVGVATILATVWVTVGLWHSGPPRRLLIYSMPIATSLLTVDTRNLGLSSSDLRITYQEHALTNPYFVRFRMDNPSRKGIGSGEFDDKRPIVFDMSAPIRAVMGAEGPIVSQQKAIINDTTIQIEPTLIHQGLAIQLDLLIDGEPQLTCESPFAYVKVKNQSPEHIKRQRNRIRAVSFCMLLAIILPIFAIRIYQAHRPEPLAIPTVTAPPGDAVAPNFDFLSHSPTPDPGLANSDLPTFSDLPSIPPHVSMTIGGRSAVAGSYIEVGARFAVSGVADDIPGGDDLWLVAKPTTTDRWYPFGQVTLATDGKWSLKIAVNKNLKGSMSLDVVMLSAPDNNMFMRNETGTGNSQYLPPGLSSLPRGSQVLSIYPIVVQ